MHFSKAQEASERGLTVFSSMWGGTNVVDRLGSSLLALLFLSMAFSIPGIVMGNEVPYNVPNFSATYNICQMQT